MTDHATTNGNGSPSGAPQRRTIGLWTGQPRPVRRTTPDELRARKLAAGSMGPKVEAAARFAEQTGRAAAIGALDEAALLLDGVHGTTVACDPTPKPEDLFHAA
jgi:hypothetical protein